MEGRLYLHIGPPKSGTTSLQLAFDKINHPQFVYGGVYQPRDRNAGSLANRLHQGLKEQESRLLQGVAEEVRSLVAQGNQVMISEEMLLLTQGPKKWRKKLDDMRELFNDIPTTVIISLRDPLEGVPSLYQEIFSGLPLRYKINFSRFCESDIASCYDFDCVQKELSVIGYDDIRFLSFDGIRKGNISSADLLGENDILKISQIPIGHANAGDKKANANQRKVAGVTLKNLGQLPPVRWAIERFGLRSAPWYRHFVNRLDVVSLRRAGYRNLTVPADSAERFSAGYRDAMAEITEKRISLNPTTDIAQSEGH
ncbi:hypothetical protein [Halomonas sp. CKK8]|uniref:hypothetical protein n=1 Tax=Halomonas sp. CKK8 TaxID=3036127 RepID=UPI002415689A|nr:hypothetical protein [Halomonas sp. CKK8]WFM70000.1 hypothetical protein P8934_11275 [Halomonas sp. CKK8]